MAALNIVFAGTPEFGLPCLAALQASQHRISAIYTQPDRPAGRGRQYKPSPVKAWALEQQVAVYQPSNFKLAHDVEQLAALKPDIMVVIAYGLLLPPSVLAIPRLGCINVHASLLPRWRGASPIQQAILHGDNQSGVTIMQMDVGLDTGASLAQAVCDLSTEETAGSLHDKLAQLGVGPLLATLDQLAQGTALATPQEESKACYAHKITKADGKINWQDSAITIDRQIRAFNPWPIAYTALGINPLRIHKASPLNNKSNAQAGTILAIDKTGMLVSTGEGQLCVQSLQFAGGKIISITDWINSGHAQQWVNTVLS